MNMSASAFLNGPVLFGGYKGEGIVTWIVTQLFSVTDCDVNKSISTEEPEKG